MCICPCPCPYLILFEGHRLCNCNHPKDYHRHHHPSLSIKVPLICNRANLSAATVVSEITALRAFYDLGKRLLGDPNLRSDQVGSGEISLAQRAQPAQPGQAKAKLGGEALCSHRTRPSQHTAAIEFDSTPADLLIHTHSRYICSLVRYCNRLSPLRDQNRSRLTWVGTIRT